MLLFFTCLLLFDCFICFARSLNCSIFNFPLTRSFGVFVCWLVFGIAFFIIILLCFVCFISYFLFFLLFPKRIKCIVDTIKTEACSLIDGLNRLDVHDLFAANNLCKMLFYN